MLLSTAHYANFPGYRKQFLKQRSAAVVVQKYWRGHKGRKLYKLVSYWEQNNKFDLNGPQTVILLEKLF